MKKTAETMGRTVQIRWVRRLIVISILITILFIGMVASIAKFEWGNDNFIYDQKEQKIVAKLNPLAQIKYNLETKRYIIIPKKIELVNIESAMAYNIAYKAKFQMQNNEKAIQEYLAGSLSNDQIQKDLAEEIGSCIRTMARGGLQVKGYSSLLVIRAITIFNMDQLCPLANSHGYQLDEIVELVQCAGSSPFDNAQKNDCLNSARSAHY